MIDKAEYQRRWHAKNPGYSAAYNASRRQPLQAKRCEECGKSFTTSRNSGLVTKRFCTAECREAVRRRRHWRGGHSVGSRARRRVLERDEWRCYLCDKDIDRSYKWPHPLSPTVDHVIPFSVCGHDRISNLRATHWACNVEKGDRLPGTEVWVPAS